MGDSHKCDTVIIGGGLAGLTAARTFEAHNRTCPPDQKIDYTVLEADNKIGGRAQSETLERPGHGKSIIINTGAQWIHRDLKPGTPENPLLSYVQKFDRTVLDRMPRQFFERGGRKRFSPTLSQLKKAHELVEGHTGPDTDLESLFAKNSVGAWSALNTTFGPAETGVPLHETSVEDVRNLVACNKGDFTLGGIGKFVSAYAAPVASHIKTHAPVTRIHWKQGPKQGVEISTAGGDTYHAKNCILSVSVGVLKSGQIEFDPPLPESYQRSLSHARMGNFNKVFLVFDSKYHIPVNHNTHLDVETRDGQSVFYLGRDNGQPMVTAFLGAEQAELCDKDPEKATELAIRGLTEMWGKKLRDHVIKTKVTQWGNNPLVLGGYSRVDIGHYHVREELAKPIGDVIYPAGEALGAIHPVSGRNWATHMAGAAISGERAATLITRQHAVANGNASFTEQLSAPAPYKASAGLRL